MFRGVIEGRSDAEWISRQKVIHGSSLRLLSCDEDCVFSVQQLIQLGEVISQFHEKRQNDSTVRTRVNLQPKFLSQFLMIVDLSIGNDCVLVLRSKHAEGLFSLGAEIIDGQPMEANDAGCIEMENGVIRSPWFYLLETL